MGAGRGLWVGGEGRVGYGGQYTDRETGLQYLRARHYDPVTGAFLSRDPLVSVTREAYGYVYANPLNATDPSGLFCITGVDREASEEAGEEVCNGAVELLDKVTLGRADRVGVAASVCGIVCVGLEFRKGNLYVDYGAGFHFGAGVGPVIYAQKQDEEGGESIAWSVPFVGGQFGLDDCGQIDWKDWSVGTGYGSDLDVGVSYRRQKKLLG